MTYALVSAASSPDALVEKACLLLNQQWGGCVTSRKATLMQKNYSWLLIDQSDPTTVVGHARLSPGLTTVSNIEYTALSGVVTSVVIDPALRGRGLGLQMMRLVEAEALRQGYCILALWTHDADEFYEKLGYMRCEQRRAVTTMVSAFGSLNNNALNKLEGVLSRRLDSVTNGEPAQQLVIPYSSQCQHAEQRSTIWMRKRLVDELPLLLIPAQQVVLNIRRACRAQYDLEKEPLTPRVDGWDIFLHMATGCSPTGIDAQGSSGHPAPAGSEPGPGLPWSQQVGPSCGLQALRFARFILCGSDKSISMRGATASATGDCRGPCSKVYEFHCTLADDTSDEDDSAITATPSPSRAPATPPPPDTSPAVSSDDHHATRVTRPGGRSSSLLGLAVQLGYTMCGELYNIRHVRDLAQRYLSSCLAEGVRGDGTHPHGGVQGGAGCSGSAVEVYVQGLWDLPCRALCNLLLGTDGSEEYEYNKESRVHSAHRLASTARHDRPRRSLILLPYDRDDAQSLPGLKAGAAAHYALLCGVVLPPAQSSDTNGASARQSAALPDNLDPDRVLLVGMHGLSPQPVVASYSAWVASNAQLQCASAKMVDEGDSPSLRGNCVVIRC
jgi:N-acetylglutamate synthase-like GNAT family acetyltransferase